MLCLQFSYTGLKMVSDGEWKLHEIQDILEDLLLDKPSSKAVASSKSKLQPWPQRYLTVWLFNQLSKLYNKHTPSWLARST